MRKRVRKLKILLYLKSLTLTIGNSISKSFALATGVFPESAEDTTRSRENPSSRVRVRSTYKPPTSSAGRLRGFPSIRAHPHTSVGAGFGSYTRAHELRKRLGFKKSSQLFPKLKIL